MALEAEVPPVEGRAAARGLLTQLFPAQETGIGVNRALQDGETVTGRGLSAPREVAPPPPVQ